MYSVSDIRTLSFIRNLYLDSAVITCGRLDPPSNGRVSNNAGTFGDVARYSCNEGYVFVPTETCQADGQWSWTVPTCESEWTFATSMYTFAGLGNDCLNISNTIRAYPF